MKVPKESVSRGGRYRDAGKRARLVIDTVVESDRGRYKCRADFKKSPTKNYRMELNVLGACVSRGSLAHPTCELHFPSPIIPCGSNYLAAGARMWLLHGARLLAPKDLRLLLLLPNNAHSRAQVRHRVPRYHANAPSFAFYKKPNRTLKW